MTLVRICFWGLLVTLVLAPVSGQELPILPPQAVPDVPDNGSNVQSTLKPVLEEMPEVQPGIEVQPDLGLPEEAPPQPQRDIIIDAEEVRVPSPGAADFASRPALVPDAFCTIDSAKTMQETHTSDGPRCCDSMTEPDLANLTFGMSQNRSDVATDSDINRPDAFTAVFSEAAHFATGSCESGGNCSGQPPVMIYEGMSVRLKKDGCYEVRGIVEGPRLPAILRLQLTFFTRGAKLTTVTLPPIHLRPETNGSYLANQTQIWFIRRTGYSDVLRRWPGPEHGLTVTRSGTAQIGQIPDA